jgi:hypothetical protein
MKLGGQKNGICEHMHRSLPGSIQFAIVIAIITVVIIGSLAVLTRRRR